VNYDCSGTLEKIWPDAVSEATNDSRLCGNGMQVA